jgi:hypothetical protein
MQFIRGHNSRRTKRIEPCFFGLTQTINKSIDVIFRSGNLGSSSQAIRLKYWESPLDNKNFIGGDYEEDGKSLTYFDRRLRAHYLSTLPVGDVQLATEIALFYSKRLYFVCTKFTRKIKEVQWHRHTMDLLSYKNSTYDFANRNIKTEKGDTIAMAEFLRVKINTGSWNELVVLYDDRETERNIRVFLNKQQVAEILVSLGRN